MEYHKAHLLVLCFVQFMQGWKGSFREMSLLGLADDHALFTHQVLTKKQYPT